MMTRTLRKGLIRLGLIVAVLAVAGCASTGSRDGGDRGPKAPPKCGGLLSSDCNVATFVNNGPNPVSFRAETVCTTVAACVNTNVGTRGQVFLAYCDGSYQTTCRQCSSDCSSPGTCEPKFDSGASNGLSMTCAAAPRPPGCAAPKIGCKCTPTVAAAGKLKCGCGCR